MSEAKQENLEELKKIIKIYPGLSIQTNKYVFNDGNTKDLLNLKGTIQINYKGNSYNIPIRIWVMDTHPKNAPMCYVEPTPEMFIRPSRHVDQNGKIYLPYLHEWNPKTSELLSLIQILILTFSQTTPLYSKSNSTAYSGNPQPNPTPYPVGYGYMPYPSQQPGMPAYPNYPNYPAMPATPYPIQPTHPTPTPTTSISATGTITDEHIRDSLLSAIEDKLRRKMREVYSQNEAELETLKKTKQELLQGKQKLNDIMRRLNGEKYELENNLKVIEVKSVELDKLIEKLKDKGSIDVDDAVVATTPLFNQMLNTHAEESAIEDTIYYMDEGLRRGVINLDAFLKQVRHLSYKQFMLRALMKKCRQTAGLSTN